MKDKVEELIEIIKNGVEIASSQDDEQFVKNAIIRANKLAVKFSEKNWESFITKLPIENKRSCEYDKIKKTSIKSIVENEDSAITFMINESILDVIIKNAPDTIKTLATDKIKNRTSN